MSEFKSVWIMNNLMFTGALTFVNSFVLPLNFFFSKKRRKSMLYTQNKWASAKTKTKTNKAVAERWLYVVVEHWRENRSLISNFVCIFSFLRQTVSPPAHSLLHSREFLHRLLCVFFSSSSASDWCWAQKNFCAI